MMSSPLETSTQSAPPSKKTQTPPQNLERAPLSSKGASLVKYRYDIVLGCPRSGTTFLADVLNAIPTVECITGTILPVSIPQIVNAPDLSPALYDALAVGFERALDDYMESGRFQSRAAALQKWINAPTGLKGLYNALMGRRHLDRIIYKEPFLSFAPEFVYYALPDAKIIHIYRDGRDCANSLIRTYDVLSDENLTHLMGAEMRLGRAVGEMYIPWWVEEGREQEFLDATPFGRAIWMWAYMVRRCDQFFSLPEVQDSGRVMLLRYEDFMQAPDVYGEKILDHLELESTKAFHRHLRTAHTGSIGKHERRRTPELEEAERIAGPELARYGYL
jgi:hypothetical protein